MTVQQLKYILTTAETGSITEAAKQLFISQPSLSNVIKDTENEVGISIFVRAEKELLLQKKAWSFWGMQDRLFSRWNCLRTDILPHFPKK